MLKLFHAHYLPADVRRFFGFALSLAQAGDKHDAAKALKGFGSAGVLEIMKDGAWTFDVGDSLIVEQGQQT